MKYKYYIQNPLVDLLQNFLKSLKVPPWGEQQICHSVLIVQLKVHQFLLTGSVFLKGNNKFKFTKLKTKLCYAELRGIPQSHWQKRHMYFCLRTHWRIFAKILGKVKKFNSFWGSLSCIQPHSSSTRLSSSIFQVFLLVIFISCTSLYQAQVPILLFSR